MDPDTTTDVGRSPGTSLKQDQSGATEFEEQREDGTHKLTTVLPDGEVSRTIERTDPSTGIRTKVTRHPDGALEREVEWPGGQTETTINFPDGSAVGHRTFLGPDGSSWSQDVDNAGRLQTTHDAYQPDGTLRHTVKNFDGSIEVTKTKTTKLEDGSQMTKITSSSGSETTRIVRSDESSEVITRHPNGSIESVTVTRTEDGKLVQQSIAADGSKSTTTNWTTPDGHLHRTVVQDDGSTQTFENWEDRLPDGTTVRHFNTPDGTEIITDRPDGSTERIKQHADGTTTSFTRTKEADGSIHEHQVRADGSTRDARYTENVDGTYSTHTRDFDGTERTTEVGPDGRVEVHTINPDGTRVNSSYSPDGSGRTDVLDADGNIDRSTPIKPDPRPVPRGGHDPEKFIDNAHKELGPDVPIDVPDFTGEAGGFAAVPLSEAEVGFLEERGVALPDAVSSEPEIAATDAGAPEPAITGEASGKWFDRTNPGPTILTEDLPDGTHRSTSVSPDGSVMNSVERTDPSTGFDTEVVRSSDGFTRTTVDTPGGISQTTTRHPDGSEETFRAGLAPDGSQWSQVVNADGVQTTRMTFDPDGTLRSVVKQPDGTVEVTTSKTTYNKDGSSVSEVHSPNGDVSTMVTQPDGSSEMRLLHPDGTESVSVMTTNPDGSTVFRSVSEDGSVTMSTEWTSEDGHSHREVQNPDGSTESYETFGEVREDGSSFITAIGPNGTETTNYAADGVSFETVKENADGTTETRTLTKNPDGSMVDRETRADGATKETHYEPQSLDGSYTTITRDFDGVETRTTMDENGRISVREENVDGTSTETDYNPDGSGRAVTFDAAGNVTGETAIEPTPPPVAHDFDPGRFISDAQSELPPDVGMADAMGVEPGSRVLTDAEVEMLSERGIAPVGVDDLVAATDLDDATMGEALTGAAKMYDGSDADLEMPAGALGDPDLVNVYRTENVITPDPYPEEQIWPGEEKIEGMDGEEEMEMEVDPVAVDGPEEDIILPEPNQEEQIWPEEEPIEDVEPAVEQEPIGPDPAVEEPEL